MRKHREIIVLIGKPGSGKGTQAEPLGKLLGIPAISVGKMYRDEIAKGTAIGKEALAYVKAGKLVPNKYTALLIKRRLEKDDTKKGAIVDGTPRDLEQSEILNSLVPVTHAILISISDNEVFKRLSGRRVCKQCGRNYHVDLNPPRVKGVCDACGGEVVRRDDDTEEVIEERLKSYEHDTLPAIEFFREKGALREVNGKGSIDEVNKRIMTAIGHADQRRD